MNDLIGQNLDQYRIVATLDEGGMTRLYKAFQPGRERIVAIKVLSEYHLRDENFPARFQNKAQSIARLNHPNILPIYDFGCASNVAYLVMRYVEGDTLSRVMGQAMPFKQIGNLLGQVAAALDYAHGQGIMHHNLTPGNILIEQGKRALLSNFGLAKIVAGNGHLPTGGLSIGSPAYISPEQGEGKQVDARADIYALGVILYESITGRLPFISETPLGVIIQHIAAPLPLPRAINPDIPESIEQVILKALAKNVEDRYAGAGAMMAAFNRAVAARPEPLVTPGRQSRKTWPACPWCRHLNRPGIKFCENCATLLTQAGSTCFRCSYTNRPEIKFCENCAALLA